MVTLDGTILRLEDIFLFSRRSTDRGYLFIGTVYIFRIHVDLHTLVVIIVLREVKCKMSYLPLGEVMYWRMVLWDVFAKVFGTGCPELPKLSM